MPSGEKIKVKWDESAIRAVAAECVDRNDFKLRFPVACRKARKAGFLDELHPRKTTAWTRELLRKEAEKYDSRSAFERGSPGAFKALARHPGLIDEIAPSSRWTQATAVAAAKTCTSRDEFREKFGGAYSWIWRNNSGLLVDIFGPLIFWTEADIREAAGAFTSRNDFFLGARGAYSAAWRSFPGLIEELFPIIQCGGGISDNDVIYIWRAVGQFFNGDPVYKIGVTSARLGTKRVAQVSRKSGFEFDLICCEAVACRATELERRLHLLGHNPEFVGFDGCTEFRAMSDPVLWVALGLISEATVRKLQ